MTISKRGECAAYRLSFDFSSLEICEAFTMDDEDSVTSYSEDDYPEEDKLLFDNIKNSERRKKLSVEEVFGFEQSESDDEDREAEEDKEEEEDFDDDDDHNETDIDIKSDLEDEEQLHDDRAWGKKKKNFYNTDFVDQDYEGIYQGKEAEVAELEEQEAKNIQRRLIEQLNDTDFSITETIQMAEAIDASDKQEVILSDLTKLTKRQKLDLLKKESPEFFVLVQDCKKKLQEARELLLVKNYFKRRVKNGFPALDFLQIKLTLILNYCTNISFYLFLKSKRIPIKNHPILRSLFRYRKFFEQLEQADTTIFDSEFVKVLKMIKSGKEIPIDNSLLKKKVILKLLSKKKHEKAKALRMGEEKQEEIKDKKFEDDEVKESPKEESSPGIIEGGVEKRAITYEMAKNKGLIPKRSKEQRNPRVKHRRKYEKAKIRRRGQVRTPRAEIPVYGGEPTGIKIGLTKSIKLKY